MKCFKEIYHFFERIILALNRCANLGFQVVSPAREQTESAKLPFILLGKHG